MVTAFRAGAVRVTVPQGHAEQGWVKESRGNHILAKIGSISVFKKLLSHTRWIGSVQR